MTPNLRYLRRGGNIVRRSKQQHCRTTIIRYVSALPPNASHVKGYAYSTINKITARSLCSGKRTVGYTLLQIVLYYCTRDLFVTLRAHVAILPPFIDPAEVVDLVRVLVCTLVRE